MKVFIASDHAAYHEKQMIIEHLKAKYEVIDIGTDTPDSTHYPEWAFKLVKSVVKEKTLGILMCGSGMGVCMAANRFKHVRAALCRDEDDAKMGRLHNDANVVCLSGRKTPPEALKKIVDTFLTSPFEGGRHQTRIDQFDSLGEMV